MQTRIVTCLLLAALLCACSKPAPPAAPARQQATTTQPATPSQGAPITKENQGILTDTQRDGLNNANQVSNVLKQNEEERRKKMEAQGI